MINFFFFNDTATTEIYTLSLHDALPISTWFGLFATAGTPQPIVTKINAEVVKTLADPQFREKSLAPQMRSEEHTSELQSQSNLVCRLLLEKKKKIRTTTSSIATTAPSIT